MDLFSDTQFLFIIAAAAAGLALFASIMTIILYSRMKKFSKAYISLQTFLSGTKLEDLLRANLQEVRELSRELNDQGTRLKQTEKKLRSAIDRAELIRFNSFENMGAELSFALALLNQEGTGVVLTGIHSVEESRIYAKAIEKGQSPVKLSVEEKQAIERASHGVKV